MAQEDSLRNKINRFKGVITNGDYSVKREDIDVSSDFGIFEKPDEWENIIKLYKRSKGHWSRVLTNDELRMRVQFFVVYFILGTVSLGMTILNVFTDWALLGYATLVFFILCYINCILCLISETTENISRVLFSIEIISLFAFFAIVGNPEGFSILWSLILPTCGLILYKAKAGSLLALVQWIVLILLFWTQPGKSILMYDYTESFLQRFPLLYLACFFVGVFFEFVRANTHDELEKSRKRFEYLYKHDALTGLFNRYGLNAEIDKAAKSGHNTGHAFAIADIDDFKKVNDTYGHMNGDVVLKTVGGIIKYILGDNGYACRWGGEEFSIVFFNEVLAESICKQINKAVSEHEFDFDGKKVHVTISIGVVITEGERLPSESNVITQADENLYISKTTGKNKITLSILDTNRK